MCNACGFYCCAIDTFDKCGCDGCPCEECWSDDDEPEYEDVADELHKRDTEEDSAMNERPTEDETAGMAWWNAITEQDRAYWLQLANSAKPADAWAAFKRSRDGLAKGKVLIPGIDEYMDDAGQ